MLCAKKKPRAVSEGRVHSLDVVYTNTVVGRSQTLEGQIQ